MNREDLGEYFKHGYEIYQAIGYIDQPALELKNIITGERKVIVIDSPLSMEYHKLYENTQDDRIQKAIEYIEELYNTNSNKQEIIFINNIKLNKLLDILKGEDNE